MMDVHAALLTRTIETQENFGMMYAGRCRRWSLKTGKISPQRSLKPLNTDSLHARTRGLGWPLRQWTFVLESRELHECWSKAFDKCLNRTEPSPVSSYVLPSSLSMSEPTRRTHFSAYNIDINWWCINVSSSVYELKHPVSLTAPTNSTEEPEGPLNTRGSGHVARPPGLLQLITQRRVSESPARPYLPPKRCGHPVQIEFALALSRTNKVDSLAHSSRIIRFCSSFLLTTVLSRDGQQQMALWMQLGSGRP
ncbi:uncharacterized protein BJ212DRAFT_1589204 [Suillus subaureus]|uniref:Uncharacterized protein n=1 Tax=Suillus subaureus TaxID=48587 RepID=A0A9P7E6J9_9AGAM|nr:uncharacterized protein BJ212DRAFT_1589204 [Suillus subaureus]KAG1812246.1 hypothetical protein BJ212DRAFT_1589204 [Suillus subaureus]